MPDPGWTFTPGVIVGALYDTNVARHLVGRRTRADRRATRASRSSRSGSLEVPQPAHDVLDAATAASSAATSTSTSWTARPARGRLAAIGARPAADVLRERQLLAGPDHGSARSDGRAVPRARLAATTRSPAASESGSPKHTDWPRATRTPGSSSTARTPDLTGGIVNGIQTGDWPPADERLTVGVDGAYRFADMDLNEGTSATSVPGRRRRRSVRLGQSPRFERPAACRYLDDRTPRRHAGPARTSRASISHTRERATLRRRLRAQLRAVVRLRRHRTRASRCAASIRMPLDPQPALRAGVGILAADQPVRHDRACRSTRSSLHTARLRRVAQWFARRGLLRVHAPGLRSSTGGEINRHVVGVAVRHLSTHEDSVMEEQSFHPLDYTVGASAAASGGSIVPLPSACIAPARCSRCSGRRSTCRRRRSACRRRRSRRSCCAASARSTRTSGSARSRSSCSARRCSSASSAKRRSTRASRSTRPRRGCAPTSRRTSWCRTPIGPTPAGPEQRHRQLLSRLHRQRRRSARSASPTASRTCSSRRTRRRRPSAPRTPRRCSSSSSQAARRA